MIGLFLMSFFIGMCPPGNLHAQDDVEIGQQAFAKKKYPWYDSKTDEVKRIEMDDRPSIRSTERNSIPLKSLKKTKPRGAWNWNWGGSFLGGLSLVAWLLIGAVIVGLAMVLVWAFMGIESNQPMPLDLAAKRTMAESISQLPFELDAASGNFRQLSANAYAAGDFRKAMIYLFSHVLVSLDQKGLIRLRKGKTNRQYLRELRSFRPLANYYQRVMVPFEATFFGDHELEKEEFESCWNQLSEFQKGVDQTSQVTHV